MTSPLKIGHRGASGYFPENTLTAFREALKMGADGVELDVHCCASGEVVVIHDDTVDRTTNGKGKVSAMPFSELKKLSVAGKEKVAMLTEALEVLGKETYCFVEVKENSDILATAKLLQSHIERGWNPEKLWLISFEHERFKGVKAAFPELSLGASFRKLDSACVDKALTLGVRAVIPQFGSVTEAEVKKAQANGLKMIVWTVDTSDDIARMRAMGVDGIISNYPDRLTT